MAHMNAFSSGMLVGCALAVVLPHGFEASSHGGGDGHEEHQHHEGASTAPLLAGYILQVTQGSCHILTWGA
jgi:hypothetical protein